jgi:hypothetical protein
MLDAPPPFPAQTAAQVVGLWEQHSSDGRVVYAVRQGSLRYFLTFAGTTPPVGPSTFRFDVAYGSVRYILGERGSTRLFACFAAGGPLVCGSRDPRGMVARVVGKFAAFLEPSTGRRYFSPPALRRAKITQSIEVGQPVSCASGTYKTIPVRVCLTAWGYPTRLILGNSFAAIAVSASQHVKKAQIRRPE